MSECIGQSFILNGKLLEKDLFDSWFLYGPDYVYEVFRVKDGVALFLGDHLTRLYDTCRMGGIFCNYSHEQISEWVYNLIEANVLHTGNIKIVAVNKADEMTDFMVYVTPHEYPTAEMYEKGVDISLFRGMRHNPNAKIMDIGLRDANNRMKQEKHVYETLLVDKEGYVTEGSRSNVFFIREGKVITPPVEDVLPGVTRKKVVEICHKNDIPLVQEKVLARSLVIMEAIFITGTSRKVLPVRQVDGVTFDATHPLIKEISEAFDNVTGNYIQNFKVSGKI